MDSDNVERWDILKNVIQMFEKDSIEILTAESSHSFPLHSHESFCLGVVNQGKVHFQVGDQEKILSKGMNYLIPSNIGVIITPVEKRYGYTTICFKNQFKEYLMNYDYDEYFPKLHAYDQIHDLCDAYINGSSSQFFMDGIISILKRHMLEKTTVPSMDEDLMECAKKYIRNHIYEPFDLDSLAEYVHISKYHFIRKFKKQTGVTPNQYYIQAKISAAKQALKQNEKETDVAIDLNFSDQSYLCNVFKKQMGISMKDFKKNYTSIE